jgi:fructosamine-3-kinase
MWQAVCERINEVTGEPFHALQSESVGGGCINSAHVLSDGERSYFVKRNRASLLYMFEAEYEGLQEIVDSNTVRAPIPCCTGVSHNHAYIVLEYLPIQGRANGESGSLSMEKLGWGLANMHRITRDTFGWHRDNTIGSTPQRNSPCANWVEFWKKQRLAFQLELAAQNGFGRALATRGERLLSHIDSYFTEYDPKPSLLHGDLWSGNYSVTDNGQPVIFDPAVYFGDRETDLAMTELFGGFPARFYDAYNERYALNEGYSTRKVLYNLYHILNHLNLFGGGYLAQAQSMMDNLLSEIK